MDWKVPAGAAGAAFLISLFAGAVGGVPFGTILLRGLISAAAFGGLFIGIDWVARQYLPELFEGSENPDSDAVVDITLDEENPHAAEGEAPSESRRTEPTAEGGPSAPPSGVDDDLEAGEFEETALVEDIGGADSDGVADAGKETKEGSDASPTSELPSFDGLESAFEGGTAEGQEEEAQGSANSSTVDVMGSEEDPAVIAQAVRTLMNRDKEG